MKPVDLLLIHPPATFRSPTNFGLHSMIAASVPSTPAFEMYPLGFLSIGEYLQRHGYHVSICNLALLNSVMPQFRPETIIRRIQARIVGIDLHWATHTDGVLELAKIFKNIHPNTHIVVGGFTASAFWRELLSYPDIDFVMRGDSTEYPFLCLLNVLIGGGNLNEVPNLAWRDNDDSILTTGLEWVPDNIDDYRTDYAWGIRSAARHIDPVNVLLSIPYRDWLTNPSAAVLTQRGCSNNCLICGGSANAYLNIFNRKRTAVKSPGAVIRDVASAARILRGRIFIGSDLQEPGEEYYHEVFQRYESLRINNPLTIEVIQPAPSEFFEAAAEAGSVTLQMSAESHDEDLRMRFGRNYTNDALEGMIGAALDAGIKAVRIFFGIGLPGQDTDSVMETVNYCGELLSRFGRDGRFFPFISVLAPYIEPGSCAFDEPERYGYRSFCSTLEDYRNSMRQYSWAQSFGYETYDMERSVIIETTYKATIELNRLHERHNLITARNRQREEERLKREWQAVQRKSTHQVRCIVGESSLYTSRLRGFFIKPFAFHPFGILNEVCVGLRRFFSDMFTGKVKSPWKFII